MPIIKKPATRDTIFDKKYRMQTLASMTAHLMTFSHGIFLGWLSPIVQLLQSPDTPLSFDVTVEEISWIGSLYGLGSLSGNIIFGLLLDRIGRKWCMILMALPHITFWFLVYFAQNVEYLYIARFLGGITGGAQYVVVPIFIGEIAEPSIRGALTSLAMLLVCVGILLGFVFGSYLNYFLTPCIIIVFPILFIIAVFFLPETAQFLLKKGNVTAAERSFAFYKNLKNETVRATTDAQGKNEEFNELKRIMLKGNQGTEVTVKDFVNKHALLAFCTCFMIIVLNQFSGSFAFINYMSSIFAATGTTMDPNMATIIVGVIQIVGTLSGSFLVDRSGRRPLILTSSCGMAIGLLAYGLFAQLAPTEVMETFTWVPITIMTLVLFIVSLGVVALLFVLIVELLPAKIRGPGTAICMGFLSCLVFISLKVYPIMINDLGISITMYICSGVCVICFIYLSILLPETKGKSLTSD